MEHHANIVPWHFLRERQGVVLKWVDVDANGDLDPQAVIDAIGPKTKLVAITHMSNVLGTVVDVKPISPRPMPRACRCWSMAARRRCTCRSTSTRSAAISTRSPATSSTARPAPARSYQAERMAEMRPSWAAAT
jgi:hypothetical protein